MTHPLTPQLEAARTCLAVSGLAFQEGKGADAHKALSDAVRHTLQIMEALIGDAPEEDEIVAATVAAGKDDPSRGPVPASLLTARAAPADRTCIYCDKPGTHYASYDGRWTCPGCIY